MLPSKAYSLRRAGCLAGNLARRYACHDLAARAQQPRHERVRLVRTACFHVRKETNDLVSAMFLALLQPRQTISTTCIPHGVTTQPLFIAHGKNIFTSLSVAYQLESQILNRINLLSYRRVPYFPAQHSSKSHSRHLLKSRLSAWFEHIKSVDTRKLKPTPSISQASETCLPVS
jgi:hypothetical protein